MRSWAILLLCCIFVVWAVPVLANETTDQTSLTVPDPSYTNVVRPVSVDELNTKLDRLLSLGMVFAGGLLVRLAQLMLIISALIMCVGWLFKSSTIREAGIRGVIMSSLGLLTFWSIPFIIQMVNAVAQILNS